jgi:beta-barrel assembly-enhancing protease
MRCQSLIVATVAVFGTMLVHARETGVRLPDIGSSAGEIMSPREARWYGASMLHELRSLDLVLDDPLLADYINTLGYRLVAHSDKPDQKYTFFVVRDSGINAFAAPGGYIGVNAGLITTAESESEVAAVLAHEVAHITQLHMQRAFEDAQKASLPIALAMLGALIASQGASGDAAEAAIVTGTSLMQQRQINFTRQDEVEADRVGIQALARSGYDPDAMAGFFARMDRALRPSRGDGEFPDLLRTHPVNTARISDAKARAEGIRKEIAAAVPVELPATVNPLKHSLALNTAADQFTPVPKALPKRTVASVVDEANFALMRERARVLASAQPGQLLIWYANNIGADATAGTPAQRYGYALALTRNNQGDAALALLAPLLREHPDSLPIQIAMANAEAYAGRRADALTRFERMLANSPDHAAVSLSFAQALVDEGGRSGGRRAQNILRPMMAQEIDDPEFYRVFARASELAGDPVRAAEAYADVALLNGRLEDALNLLKRLTERKDLDYYQRARIDARIADVTPYVLELRRRGVKPEDQGKHVTPAFSCAGADPCSALSPFRNTTAVK